MLCFCRQLPAAPDGSDACRLGINTAVTHGMNQLACTVCCWSELTWQRPHQVMTSMDVQVTRTSS